MSALGRWWLCLGIAGILLQFEVPLAVACLLVLLLGALMGTLAGVLRGVFNVPSFVATLGLWSALRGMGLFMTNALPVPIDENEVLDWLGGQFLGVPVSALIMIVLFALFVFISRKTAFGRSVFAVGGNATAAQLCGINVRRVRILIFTLSGLLAAVTGICWRRASVLVTQVPQTVWSLTSSPRSWSAVRHFPAVAVPCSVHCLVCW